MKPVFIDTHYLVASINPLDQWHQRALEIENELIGTGLVTTEGVLVETLNYFCSLGTHARLKVARVVHRLLEREDVEVIPQTEETFSAGLKLYEDRPDKGYSLTDCISMNVMRERGLTDVLTNDPHFHQEGYRPLL
jgi:predicted nucleic acid-binding protein